MTLFHWDWLLKTSNTNENIDKKTINNKENTGNLPKQENKENIKLTNAQQKLLKFLNEPKTFKEMKDYMINQGYTMGINFERLRELGLIEKQGNLWHRKNLNSIIPEGKTNTRIENPDEDIKKAQS